MVTIKYHENFSEDAKLAATFIEHYDPQSKGSVAKGREYFSAAKDIIKASLAGVPCFVAYEGTDPVGIAQLNYFEFDEPPERSTRLGYLIVKPDQRGKGIGLALCKAFLAKFPVASVASHTKGLDRLFKAAGFQYYANLPTNDLGGHVWFTTKGRHLCSVIGETESPKLWAYYSAAAAYTLNKYGVDGLFAVLRTLGACKRNARKAAPLLAKRIREDGSKFHLHEAVLWCRTQIGSDPWLVPDSARFGGVA